MLSAPGMRERTIKIGSAGKMFSMTGWKVGFACAAPKLTEAFVRAHQFLTFTTPPNLQTAVAFGLSKPKSFFEDMRAQLVRSRDRLAGALQAEGFHVLPSAGTYFLGIDLQKSGIALRDTDFAIRAVKEAGVATIPVSAFYTSQPESSVIRLCFAKHDATLDAGAERLAKARRLMA
jgi:aspartate/methionine/tyrosine aminotransferase